LSIFEETGGAQAAVAHDRSLELFCDRYDLIARFASLINDDPPPRRLLYLYGLGGNGKSLLLRYLAARCCVRLPPEKWARVRGLPDADLPAALGAAKKVTRVPVARIDFAARPVGENRPQECFSALFMLKQQLAGHRIATPRFDFAAVTYLHKLGFDLGRRLPELFPRGEVGLALDLADALLPVPVHLVQVGQDLFDALDRRLDDAFTRRRVQRRLPKADAAEILSLAPEPDLIDQLPRLFAADLRGALSEKGRQLLLVARHLVATGGRVAEREFLVQLALDLPAMRGAGPTTRAAVARYQQTGQTYATSGDTNGALMRILPAGWAIPATSADRRRDVVTRLSRVTHGAPMAAASACAVAAMASFALDHVILPDRAELDELANGLHEVRRAAYG